MSITLGFLICWSLITLPVNSSTVDVGVACITITNCLDKSNVSN